MVQHRRQLGSIRQHEGAEGGGRERGLRLQVGVDSGAHQRGRDGAERTASQPPAQLAVRGQRQGRRRREIRQVLCGDRHSEILQRRHDDAVLTHRQACDAEILSQRKNQSDRTAYHRRRCVHRGQHHRQDLRENDGAGRTRPCRKRWRRSDSTLPQTCCSIRKAHR